MSESFAAGFESIEAIESDDDLKSLRELPEFKTLFDNKREELLNRFQQATRAEMKNHNPFPFNFNLPDLQGEKLSLSDLKGKIVIVDFWGTWCGPCVQEIPHFVKLKQKYAGEGFEIVGISYENGSKEEIIATVKGFHAENNMNYPCVIGDEATQAQVPNLEGYPTTLFIDRKGTVRLKEVGYHSFLELEAVVTLLLEEEPADASTNAQ